MIPLDSPHAWDAHWRAWEVIHSRGTPLLPTGYTNAGSTATTDGASNTTKRPPRCAPRLPRDALGSPSTPHMRGTRVDGHRDACGGVVGMYTAKTYVFEPSSLSSTVRVTLERDIC